MELSSSMKMKKVLLSILSLTVLLLLLALALFVTPLVVYVEPSVPEVFCERLSAPSFLGKGWLCLRVKEENLEKLALLKPDLVVWTPLSEVVEGEWRNLQYGTSRSSADVIVTVEADALWREALGELQGKTCGILYPHQDSSLSKLAERLLEEYPNLVSVGYNDKVGSAQKDIVASMDALDFVLVLDPQSSRNGYQKTSSRVVMDFRDAAAAVSLDRVVSVGLDWNWILKKALEGESMVSARFALSVTKK